MSKLRGLIRRRHKVQNDLDAAVHERDQIDAVLIGNLQLLAGIVSDAPIKGQVVPHIHGIKIREV